MAAVMLQGVSAKTVMAHFMVSNAYAYDENEWYKDIVAAQDMGIDGFVLNMMPFYCGSDTSWVKGQVDSAYKVSQHEGFMLMPSFDMSNLNCPFGTSWNVTGISDMVYRYKDSNATYRWNGQSLVTTYGGESYPYGNDFFAQLKDNMADLGHPIVLSPALVSIAEGAQPIANDVDSAIAAANASAHKLINDYPAIDGFTNWQAWPLQDQNITNHPDNAFMEQVKGASGKTGPYIMGVSPWQFKDLNDPSKGLPWVAYSDTLFSQRFQQLINADIDHQPDIIELLTWNDFCESHYLRDLPSPNVGAKDYIEVTGDMNDYIQGMDHSPWRIMAKYYISWWKNKDMTRPVVTEDQVIFWHRLHPKASTCAVGSQFVRNSNEPVDAVFAWALVKQAATISMSVGSNEFWTFSADGSGPVTNMVPFPDYIPDSGISPEVAIMRNGRTQYVTKSAMPITNYCARTNFNPIVNLVGTS
ncbi:glycoside hydrolase family 71 protein [Polychaeton citri CBS 116435]|uniref:Glycoside hydrolase family 71 protein n=1 Tax=Polychaeton citri CBS 116435 TaxID=1314669 RepID=A0A9P4QB77_9PEZI|nr:glycoside hydrolase family 71 protein [Polychaeton citri CBS 116435]